MRARGLPVTTRAERDGDRLTVRIQRPLVNFNSDNRHPHWGQKDAERRAWRSLIVAALLDATTSREVLALLAPSSDVPGARGGTQERKRVHVIRGVPSKRNFIRDDFDNLRWCTKELRDALKGLGLIRDDTSKWCEMSIDQAVTEDQRWWTTIVIEPAEVSA